MRLRLELSQTIKSFQRQQSPMHLTRQFFCRKIIFFVSSPSLKASTLTFITFSGYRLLEWLPVRLMIFVTEEKQRWE